MTQTTDPLKFFKYGMKIPTTFLNPDTKKIESATGKLTHSYIDEPFRVQIEDYKHNMAWVSELSCVHLEDANYELSMAQAILDRMNGVQLNVYE